MSETAARIAADAIERLPILEARSLELEFMVSRMPDILQRNEDQADRIKELQEQMLGSFTLETLNDNNLKIITTDQWSKIKALEGQIGKDRADKILWGLAGLGAGVITGLVIRNNI